MLHLRPRRAVQPQSIPVSLVLGHPDRRSPSRRVLQSSTGSPTAALPLLYSGQECDGTQNKPVSRGLSLVKGQQ
jgi:hypothetical protein